MIFTIGSLEYAWANPRDNQQYQNTPEHYIRPSCVRIPRNVAPRLASKQRKNTRHPKTRTIISGWRNTSVFRMYPPIVLPSLFKLTSLLQESKRGQARIRERFRKIPKEG